MSNLLEQTMNIKIRPLTPNIGAAIEGVNLNEAIDDRTYSTLHEAFMKHSVLVFRAQYLKPAAQVQFARRWGKPAQQNPLLKQLGDFPEIVQVTKIPKETASTEAWHYDSCYTPAPPKLSMLSAITVPVGGDTMWCNQYEAYERLSPTMKKVLEGLRVRFTALRLGRMVGADAASIPSAVHPIVRTHPETGRKALYV